MSAGSSPAFPVPAYVTGRNEHVPAEPGMTLRQHYAGVALQGMLARGQFSDRHDAARRAWDYADALLAAEGRR